MSRKFIWLGVITLIIALFIWFATQAGVALFTYSRLQVRVPIKIEKWEVKNLGSDRFVVWGNYSYLYDNKMYEGGEPFSPPFLNPWTAEKEVEKYSHQHWELWLDPKKPERRALEKRIPYKKVISSSILILLALYFYGLAIYEGRDGTGGESQPK